MEHDSQDAKNELVNELINPFTDKLTLKTMSDGSQWAYNQSNNKMLPEKFRVVYAANDTKISDGDCDSKLFIEGVLAAPSIPEGAEWPKVSSERFIVLKNK